MATLRSLLISLQARTDQFERDIKRATGTLDQLRRDTHLSSQAFESFGSTLRNTAASVVSLHAIKAGISAIVQETVKLDQLMSAFKAIGGSAADAQKMLAFVRGEADRLGVNANSLADGFKQIAAAAKGTALEGQGVRDIFTAVSEASRVLGLSADQTQGALNAIGQSISKGAIQAEELRGQLGERLPGAMQVMARALGVSTERLSDMLDKGELKGQAMVNAWIKFGEQLRREFGGAVADATGKADAGFARLGNALTTTAQKMGKDLVPAIGNVSEAFTSLILSQQDTVEVLGPVLADVFRETGAAALALASGVILAGKGIAALGAFAADGMTGLNIALKDMQDFSDKMSAILDTLLNPKTPGALATPGGPGSISLDIAKAGDAAQVAADRFQDWLSPLELAKKKLQEIESQLEKLSKAGPISVGPGRAPAELQPKIHSAALKAGIDPFLFEALVKRESNFNPRAVGRVTKSGEQAKGLTQLMPGTAAGLNVKDPFNIEESLRGGAEYLAKLLKDFGTVDIALAAYNAGPGNARKYGGIPPFKETQEYVPAIMGQAAAFRTGTTSSTADTTQYNALLKQRQALLNQIAVIESDTTIGKASIDAADARAAQMEKLIVTLREGTKALSEHEIAQIREQLAAVQGFEASKAVIESLLQESEARTDLTMRINRELEAADGLAEFHKQEAEAQKKRLDEQARMDKEAGDRALRDLAEQTDARDKALATQQKQHEEIGQFALSLTDGMIDALQQGGDAWEEFGKRVADTLLRIAIEKSGFEEKLGEWISGALKLAGAFGGSTDAAVAGVGGTISGANLGGMAAGGPVSAGKSYIVGERGPEIVTFGQAGHVTSNSAIRNAYTTGGDSMSRSQSHTVNNTNAASSSVRQGDRPITVVLNVQGVTDGPSFVRSRSEIQRSLVTGLQAAQRST